MRASEGVLVAGAGRRARVVRNFVERYGRSRLAELIDAIGNGESGQAIAEAFAVSRERVRQWKNTFGTVVTVYQVHPEVREVLAEEP